jgi:biotin carboxyl carrier protein
MWSRAGTVSAAQPLLVLEAMEMERTVTAPADGDLAEPHVGAGTRADTAQVPVVVTGEAGA